jgi:ketosteroid isomerase-like protein
MNHLRPGPDGPVYHPDARDRDFAGAPFFADTIALLNAVRDRDFDTLAALCDDDFGIIDLDPELQPRALSTRAAWEAWFHELFATLDAMNAETHSEVIDYRALAHDTLGYAVVDFCQVLNAPNTPAMRVICQATVIWKMTPQGWRESRWHVSCLGLED